MSGQLTIRLVKSLNGRIENHKRIASALGLRRIRQTVVKPDTPIVRGMVRKIQYLVEVR
jgi:large subunit ribosomal protein L30